MDTKIHFYRDEEDGYTFAHRVDLKQKRTIKYSITDKGLVETVITPFRTVEATIRAYRELLRRFNHWGFVEVSSKSTNA